MKVACVRTSLNVPRSLRTRAAGLKEDRLDVAPGTFRGQPSKLRATPATTRLGGANRAQLGGTPRCTGAEPRRFSARAAQGGQNERRGKSASLSSRSPAPHPPVP
jgi:hypothetical protein